MTRTPHADIVDVMAEAYAAELARRRLETSTPRVVEVSGEGGPLLPPGSLLIATGAAGDEQLAELTAAAESGDARRTSEVVHRVRESAAARSAEPTPRPAPGADALAGIVTFGQVSYGGQVIAHAQMVTATAPVSVALLPFNGGSLPAELFSASHFHNAPGTRAETLVVIRQPLSSDIESRVSREFSAVTPEDLLGPARPEANWLAAAAFVGIVAAGVAGAYYLAHRAQEQVHADHAANEAALGGVPTTLPEQSTGRLADLVLTETAVASTSAQPSPAALLQLRTELLRGKRIG